MCINKNKYVFTSTPYITTNYIYYAKLIKNFYWMYWNYINYD